MFEREIQFIYDFNSNKVQKIGSYISLEQLNKIDIHPAILQYIVGEIDFLVFEDRQKLLKDSLFDYTIPSVANYLKLIGGEVKKNKKFSINYIDKLIQHSSSFIVNYLCKPNWSLTKFVFEDETEKSTAEVNQILNYLYYYPHLRKVISGYFEKKKIKSISLAEFSKLLEKINQAGLETNYPRIIDEAIDSIADFFNTGVFKKNLISLKSVEYFLKDYNLENHAKQMNEYFGDEPFQKCNASEIKEFLKKILIEKTEYFEEVDKNTEDTFEEVESNRNSFSEDVHDKVNEEETAEIPQENHDADVNSNTDKEENYLEPNTIDIYDSESTLPINEVNSEIGVIPVSIEDINEENDENEIDENSDSDFSNLNTEENMESNLMEKLNEQSEMFAQSIETNDNELVDEEENEMSLFDETNIETENSESEDKNDKKIISESDKKIDVTEILNDRRMAKILDVVFDYDVEEFSNAIDKICKFQTQDEADLFIDTICENAKLAKDSKESKTFKSVISKFYL